MIRSDNRPAPATTLQGKLAECRAAIAKTPFPVFFIPEDRANLVFAHTPLSGLLEFWPYDYETDVMTVSGFPTSGSEIFVGGLWPGVTASVVPWICHRFGMQLTFHDAERVDLGHEHRVRFRNCAHMRVDSADVDCVIENLHERVLFDFFGVWVAHSEQQKAALALYCTDLRESIHVRPLPCHAMTCQRASRSFRPEPRPIHVSICSPAPPPSYYFLTRQKLAAKYVQARALPKLQLQLGDHRPQPQVNVPPDENQRPVGNRHQRRSSRQPDLADSHPRQPSFYNPSSGQPNQGQFPPVLPPYSTFPTPFGTPHSDS